MLSYIFKRLALFIPTLIVVISLTFVLVRMAPGNPFTSERDIPPAVEEQLKQKYGLDGSLPEQFLRYWVNLLKGDLGPSMKYRSRSVNEIISQSLPASMAIGSIALTLALTIGTIIGSYAAVHHNTVKDRLAMLLALLGISLPAFVIAPILILLFALKLPLFPVAGWGALAHLILPSICLAAPYAAYCSRLMRTSMLEVLNQDFIRTARAKGLPERIITYKHALKVAILPLISYTGPLAAHILTGSMVVEEIFKIPGIGPFFVNSIFNRDYYLTGGTVIVYSALLIALNLLVDMVYTFLDKRVKLA